MFTEDEMKQRFFFLQDSPQESNVVNATIELDGREDGVYRSDDDYPQFVDDDILRSHGITYGLYGPTPAMYEMNLPEIDGPSNYSPNSAAKASYLFNPGTLQNMSTNECLRRSCF